MPEQPITSILSLDLTSPEAVSNPYPLYDQVRIQDPVHWNESDNYWYITRYADLMSLIRDERISTTDSLICSKRRQRVAINTSPGMSSLGFHLEGRDFFVGPS